MSKYKVELTLSVEFELETDNPAEIMCILGTAISKNARLLGDEYCNLVSVEYKDYPGSVYKVIDQTTQQSASSQPVMVPLPTDVAVHKIGGL